MTPPTLQEIAGIFMLALVTTALLVLPSSGKSHDTIAKPDRVSVELSAVAIDGIEPMPLLSGRTR